MARFEGEKLKTLGTKFEVLKAGGTATDFEIINLTSISGIKLEAGEEEITTLDSKGKEHMATLVEAGELSFSGIFKDEDTLGQFSKLYALVQSGDARDFVLTATNGMKVEFTGFVKSFGTGDIAVDGNNTFDGSIKISGLPTVTVGGAAGGGAGDTKMAMPAKK